LNENLRRALLKAQLSEDDVAAYLAVDPKTVRRWTEGRLPYLRHRWQVASLLGCDETDLWPQTALMPSRPPEVEAIYPRRDAVPQHVWRSLFESAREEIGILARTGRFLAEQPGMPETLAGRAEHGVSVRICLMDQIVSGSHGPPRAEMALASYAELRDSPNVEFRVHRSAVNTLICTADNSLMVAQYIYGVACGQVPVMSLRQVSLGTIGAAYLEAFQRTWLEAAPAR
jgi:transcriptional regulator with XRE-family HTH domain